MQEALQPVEHTMPDMAGAFQFFIMTAQLRNQQWDAILARAQPPAKDHSSLAFWHFSRGLADAAKNENEMAKREQAQFEAERKLTDRNTQWDTNKLGDVLDLASAVLSARVCASPAEAIGQWKRAVAIQDALAYDEPPAWFYPVRESLGAALLRQGDAAGAERIFREGVEQSPNNGRMLFGLLESLKAQQKMEAAAWVEHEFGVAWKSADLKLRIEDL
jgi:tetratricopeptide (TPR) repeat protein